MFNGKTILITGASSGIGEALARRFAREGAHLALVARRIERLESLAKELNDTAASVTVIRADLVESDAVTRVVAEARRATGRIDVLVNNAGVGEYGEFASQDVAAVERMMLLNMTAVIRLTHAVLPEMVARREGRVLNIASTASYQPTPYMAVYGATKSFVRNWSLSLWRELKASGVNVTCVCPGPVRTEFFDRGGYQSRRDEFKRVACDATWMAERAYQAVALGKAISTPGLVNWLGAWLTRFGDLKTVTRISARILGPK
ncbi:MAG: SDR family oxidoreductase [Planctomycetota bacterium]